jgi:hypothetical protein
MVLYRIINRYLLLLLLLLPQIELLRGAAQSNNLADGAFDIDVAQRFLSDDVDCEG